MSSMKHSRFQLWAVSSFNIEFFVYEENQKQNNWGREKKKKKRRLCQFRARHVFVVKVSLVKQRRGSVSV